MALLDKLDLLTRVPIDPGWRGADAPRTSPAGARNVHVAPDADDRDGATPWLERIRNRAAAARDAQTTIAPSRCGVSPKE